MIIIRGIRFDIQLFSILRYIAKDKKSAAIDFESELNHKIKDLLHFPLKYRASFYIEDEAYRDLIYKGYTIIYKVEKEKILMLEIFKWQNK
jgi:plasmid stabilization system protein ParE